MPKLSAVIITFNEEKNIGRCLESVKNVADEIVVVDSFSTDSTKEICEQHEVLFIQKKWEGFAEQKNFANQQASYDYVLSLDADEALSHELCNSILNIKKHKIEGVYELNRLSNYCGKWIHHCGWYPDRKIRLFPKNVRWDGDFIHEVLNVEGDQKKTLLKGNLWHYSYYTIEEHQKRTVHYAELGAKKMVERGKKQLLLKAILNPVFRFLKMYVFQLGFLDGYYGFQVCLNTSKEVYLKYVKGYQLLREKRSK